MPSGLCPWVQWTRLAINGGKIKGYVLTYLYSTWGPSSILPTIQVDSILGFDFDAKHAHWVISYIQFKCYRNLPVKRSSRVNGIIREVMG